MCEREKKRDALEIKVYLKERERDVYMTEIKRERK